MFRPKLKDGICGILVVLLMFGANLASANPVYWVDSSGDNSWETASNWSDPYAAPHVPGSNDVVYINAQERGDLITLNSQQTQNNLIFQGNGNGYTIGLPSSTSGLYFNYNTGIFIEGSLVGSGKGETINAPIESPGNLIIDNFSPARQVNVAGVNGYNNPITIAGNLQVDNNNASIIEGSGNVNITGSILGTTHFYQDSSGTTTLSGANNFTGWTVFAGTIVLDNTVNNSDKLSEGVVGKDPALVLGQNNNGGHLIIDGNEAGTTEYLSSSDGNGNTSPGHLDIRGGTNSVVLNGSTDGGGATVLNMGSFVDGFGTTIDFTANGNSAFYTTNTNNGQYGAQINILGQGVTYDKTYWARVSDSAGQGTAGYGVNSAETLITPLVNDNGDAFNSQWNNYTVDAGGQTINSAYLAATGQQEGADTIRFATAGTLDLGKGTSYTDPSTNVTMTGTGNLYMVYGGIMVTQAVTGNTAIVSGTLYNNRDLFGMTFLNYGTGTLTVGASLSESSGTYQNGNDRTDTFSFGGGGKIVLAGDNSSIAPGSNIDINSGLIQLANNNALGVDNHIAMGDVTSVLDLNGHSVHISSLTSDGNFTPGNQAAAAGLNTSVTNSAAGTLSRITIEGYSQPQSSDSDGNVSATFVDGDVNLGTYYGGLNEVSGSIISLDIEKGAASTQVQFNLGVSDPYGDPNLVNVVDPSGVQGPATNFTGSVIVGAGANLAFVNYGAVETLGATVLDGSMGTAGQQASSYSTTYLIGTGSVVSGYGYSSFDLNVIGSVADTFAGQFGSASVGASMGLVTGGTGSLDFTNPIYANLTTEGTTKLTTFGHAVGTIFVGGFSTVTVTGTSGDVTGNYGPIDVYGGILYVAPSGAGADVVVQGGQNGFQPGGHGAVVLDKGANSSLTLQMGSTSSSGYFNNSFSNSFAIGSAQGLAALGTTDKLVMLSNNGGSFAADFGRSYGPNTVLGESLYAEDYSVGGTHSATFLTYNGTGAAGDVGFEGYQYSASQIDSLNNGGGYGTNQKIDTNYTMTTSAGGLYTLEIDNGATLTTNGLLDIGYQGGTETGGLILNGGKIVGGLQGGRYLAVYTSDNNGWIDNLNLYYGGQAFAKNGPGTLFVGLSNGAQPIYINEGALDLGDQFAGKGVIILNGGVLEVSSDVNLALGGGSGEVSWAQGGFAARQATPGGSIYLTVTDSSGSENLVWGTGGSNNFLAEGAVMSFGAATANSEIFFESNLNLGVREGGYTGKTQLYSRVISVTAGSADAGLAPTEYVDQVVMDGQISGSDPYAGLAKTGTGALILTATNTYTGATTIDQGALIILDDSNLGTAPTSAYALNSTPGVSGNALTPGSVEINGGAELALLDGSTTLNANRQILLASGTTGSTPSIIDVDSTYGPSELDFGGVIADYVGEVGSLQKTGGGTFNYSGTAYNTGSYAVTAGTLTVSGSGSINSANGVTINNNSTDPNAIAQFNYASTVGLSRQVTYGTGGGTFAYNSGAVYTGSTSLTVGAKDVLAGGVNLNGNLSLTNVTIGTGGTITPGALDPAVGQLTVGALSFVQGGNYNFLLQNAWEPAGTGYSTVAATSLDLTGLSMAIPFNINLDSLVNPQGTPADRFYFYQPYTFTLVSTTAGITGFNGNDFVVNTAPTDGTTGFAPNMGGMWEVVESANGDNLLLKYTPTEAPEPATWAMLFGGLGLLAFIRRLRSRSA